MIETRRHRLHCLAAPLAGLALLALATAASAAAPPAGAAAPDSGGAVIIVFASVGQGVQLPAATADLRAAAAQLLGDSCARLGCPPVPAERTEPVQRRWRVRSDAALCRGFTQAVANELGASRLVVGRILVYPGRVLVSVRSLDPRTGRLAWADAAEAPTPDLARATGPADPAPWLAAVRQACGRLDGRWCAAPAATGMPLLIIPARTLGVEPLHGETATACLLNGLLRSGRWALTDPGVVIGALLDAGAGAARLDDKSCLALRNAFGPAPILVPELTSWNPDPRQGPVAAESGDTRVGLAPFVLSVRTVDTASEAITSRAETHRDVDEPFGWFGRRRTVSLLERYRGAAATLVAVTGQSPEER